METKKWYESKTLWVNIVGGVVVVVQYVSGINPAWAEGTAATLVILNLILRLLTNQPIDGTPGAKG